MIKSFIIIIILITIIPFNAQSQVSFDWVAPAGNSGGNEFGSNLAMDSLHNIYSLGSFVGTIDFDPTAATFNLSCTNANIFFCKYDSSGNFIWAKQIVSSNTNDPGDMIISKDGHIYITGWCQISTDFDPSPGTAIYTSTYNSLFIACYDLDGNYLWMKGLNEIGSSSYPQSHAIELDSIGNIYIAGLLDGTVDFDPSGGTDFLTAVGKSGFFAKYDNLGNYQWAKAIIGNNSGSDTRCWDIDVDEAGNLYVSGQFGGSLSANTDFDPGLGTYNVTRLGGTDAFFAKYSSNTGNFIWVKPLAGLGYERAYEIAIDVNDDLIITGVIDDTTDFDPSSGVYELPELSLATAFYGKYSPTGSLIWVKSFGAALARFTLDEQANIYFTGYTSTGVDFDPSAGTASPPISGSEDMLMVKYDSLGNYKWAYCLGGTLSTGYDRGYEMLIDDNNVYMTGSFIGTTDFDPGSGSHPITAVGSQDYFIARFSQFDCGLLNSVIDSVANVSCIGTGFATSYAYGGIAPYTYTWNTSPVTTDSIAHFNGSGFYTLTVNDSLNYCSVEHTALINGPTSFPGFDLFINTISNNFRPGLPTHVIIDAGNSGCVSSTGIILFVIDSLTNYDSSDIAPVLITGDTLMWNLPALMYDSAHYTINLYLSTDISAIIGDSVKLNATISPFSGDADTTNNIRHYEYPIVNSFDPNIKQVYPQGNSTQGYILNNQKMTYTVQFQNTGSAEAINIYVLDTLDTNLDLATLHILSSSHYLITELLPGNVLKFRFDNIHLIDSTTNESGSHGYLIYEIDQLPGLADGIQIKNNANIYFDFNPPVATNTTLNTIYSITPLNTFDQKIISQTFSVYPNPVSDELNIVFNPDSYRDPISNVSIQLLSITGQLVFETKILNSNSAIIQTKNLENGIYYLQIKNQHELFNLKIIKQ